MVTTAQLNQISDTAEPPNVLVTVMAVDIVRVMHMDAHHIVQSLISKGYTVDEVRQHTDAAVAKAKAIVAAHGHLEAEA